MTSPIKTPAQIVKQIYKAKEAPQHVKLMDGRQFLMDSGSASLFIQLWEASEGMNLREVIEKKMQTTAGFLGLISLLWSKAKFKLKESL